MMPLPMVLATFTPPPKAAMKLKKAAQKTATRGESTRVETTVAMELAASWKPLMKSKISASAMSPTTMANMSPPKRTSSQLRVFEHDALDDVGNVLAAVGGGLHQVVDLLPLDDAQGIGPALEEGGDGPAVERVGGALQPLDLAAGGEDLAGVLDLAHEPDRLLHLFARRHQHAGHVLGRLRNGSHLVEQQPLGGGVGEVEHVVDAAEQSVDLGAVEGRDELLVQPLEGAVGDPVALVLDFLDGGDLALDVGEIVEQRAEQLRAAHGGVGLGVEIVEKLLRFRHQLFQHAAFYLSRRAISPRSGCRPCCFPPRPRRPSPARG